MALLSLWLLFFSSCLLPCRGQVPQEEILNLFSLFSSTNGEEWQWKSPPASTDVKWNFQTNAQGKFVSNPCDSGQGRVWQGVTCSSSTTVCGFQTCHITGIVLSTYELAGPLPTDMNSSHLEVLDLSRNNITGTVPPELGALLPQLSHLSLARNEFEGKVPNEIGLLTTLNSLDMSINFLEGPIPSGFSALRHLAKLVLRENAFSGGFPEFLCNLTQLQQLDIAFNAFSGSIPDIISCSSQLQSLIIHSNNFTGCIPPLLGDLVLLGRLEMFNNLLTGTIPAEMGALTNLRFLALSFNSLTGTVPADVFGLPNVHTLIMDRNKLHGLIPPSIGNMTSLKRLFLSDNYFSGELPREIWTVANLAGIYINSNMLTGSIPQEIGSMTTLTLLSLSYNLLSGALPIEISKLPLFFFVILGGNFLTGPLMALPPMLRGLNIEDNQLTGSIPSEVVAGSLRSFIVSLNDFTSTIPHELALKTPSISDLRLADNVLTGSLPDTLLELPLLWFDLSRNILTGTVPSEMDKLNSLSFLILHNNDFSGPLPSLSGMQILDTVWLYGNRLSGTIPSHYGQLSKLQYLELDSNHLTGSIPSSLSILNDRLEHLLVFDNMLTGTIPSSFQVLERLEGLFCQFNFLTGSLFDSISNISSLVAVHGSQNYFSGTLTSGMGSMTNLQMLFLQSTLLEGTIPISMSQLESLAKLNLQDNRLSGRIEDNVFDPDKQLLLDTVDFSNNVLTGGFPSSLLALPALDTMVLSVNCFTDELPIALCNARQLNVMSLDGLHGASDCIDNIEIPLVDVTVFRSLGGTIPSCIWLLEKITEIHLASNGLTGRLGSPPPTTLLRSVVASHNHLSGSIPPVLLKVPNLDLSYNALTGDLPNEPRNTTWTSESIVLNVNRLSGKLPSKSWLEGVPLLNILETNIFDCASIPSNDETYDYYGCESESFDLSLYLLGSAVLVCVCIMLFVFTVSRSKFASRLPGHFARLSLKYMYYASYLLNASTSKHMNTFDKQQLVVFVRSLRRTTKAVMCLAGMLLVVSVPVYMLKMSDYLNPGRLEYTTHVVNYRWFWTYAHMKGEAIVVAVVLGWVVVITAYWAYGVYCLPSPITCLADEKRKESMSSVELEASYEVNRWHVCAMMALNIAINAAVNGTYIYLTLQEYSSTVNLAIQLSVAAFKFVYTLVFIPLLSTPMRYPARKIWFRMLMLIVNNLMIPCLAVMIESPTCFRNLFFANDEILSTYSFEICASYGTILHQKQCTAIGVQTVEIAPLTPPFSYNYQCTSTILTAYIPVFIYIYSFQVMLPFAYITILTMLRYENIPEPLYALVHAIMWPKFFVRRCKSHCAGGDESTERNECPTVTKLLSDPFLLLDSTDIITTDVLNHLIIFLCFGFCSPVLTAAISLSIFLKLNMWTTLLGRFASYFVSDHQRAPLFLKHTAIISENLTFAVFRALSRTCLPFETIYQMTLWPLIWSSAIFFSLLSWDLCSDDVGWEKALWAPATVLIVPIALNVLSRAGAESFSPMVSQDNKGVELRATIDVSSSLNPLQLQTSKEEIHQCD